MAQVIGVSILREGSVKGVCVLNSTENSSKLVSPTLIRLDEGERWYVVYTLPACEIRAQLQLGNQGFRTFLPKRQKTVRHARKLTTVVAAFFPRYLFVALDLSRDRWRSVSGTFGVASLVMQGDHPHPVPHGIVETLITSIDSRGLLRVNQDLQVGASVRLGTGPFAERLAILEHLNDSGRIRVLLKLLGRQVSVSMDSSNVLPWRPLSTGSPRSLRPSGLRKLT